MWLGEADLKQRKNNRNQNEKLDDQDHYLHESGFFAAAFLYRY
jgi:hypothetical protein